MTEQPAITSHLSFDQGFHDWVMKGECELSGEYHPDPNSLQQSYQEWLQEHPQGYMCDLD